MAYTIRSIIGTIKFEIILLFRYSRLYDKWIKHEKVQDWKKRGWLDKKELRKQLIKWDRFGKPVPPPHLLKQHVITTYQKEYNPDTFVETGTFRGDMLAAQSKHFKKMFSIELSKKLWKDAVERFQDQPQINILHGDSGTVMSELCGQLEGDVLFWLDAHYSAGVTAMGEKESPILEELAIIFRHLDQLHPIILIDDARLFVGANDYPTLKEVESFLHDKAPGFQIKVEDDIIRITSETS